MSTFPKVSNLVVSAVTNQGFTLNWAAPLPVSAYPAPIAQYDVAVSQGTVLGVVAARYTVVAGMGSGVKVTGLNRGLPYIVGVRAQAKGGIDSAGWVTAMVTTLPYVNPLGQATVYLNERVDQGVDFSGVGPVTALGDGVITETNGPGWPGGPYMAYKLSNGPAAGLYVYLAEDITVANDPNTGNGSIAVHPLAVGTKIVAGQVIATMFNGDSGIEMGWGRTTDGAAPQSQMAVCGSINGSNLPAGGTLIGRNFESLLNRLGVPAADNLNLTPGGSMPPNWPAWL